MPANKFLHLRSTPPNRDKHPIIDAVCLLTAVLMPLTAIPQILKLHTTQDSSGVSLTMWLLYLIGIVPFLIYGLVHKQLQLIILNSLWLVVSILVISAVLMYD